MLTLYSPGWCCNLMPTQVKRQPVKALLTASVVSSTTVTFQCHVTMADNFYIVTESPSIDEESQDYVSTTESMIGATESSR